jgi:hypothetical protein
MNHSSTTDEGEIVIITYAEDGVEVTTNLRTWPMKSALLPGIVIFSIATLVVAFAENVIRGVIKNRVKKPIDSSDVKPSESPVVTSGIWQEPVRPE